MFDKYSLKARLFPVFLLFVPIVFVGAVYSLSFQSITQILVSAGLLGALTYLCSELGRDNGKLKEPALWSEWGGCPSIQIMRWCDSRINKHTKANYHQILQNLCPMPTFPDSSFEASNPTEADEIYEAWTKFLISRTRDTNKFSLLFKENISYGFRRNLWGLKLMAMSIIITCGLINYLYWSVKLLNPDFRVFPYEFFVSSLVLLVCAFFWIFKVTKDWVKIPSFSYAERLFEATGQI